MPPATCGALSGSGNFRRKGLHGISQLHSRPLGRRLRNFQANKADIFDAMQWRKIGYISHENL
jgi:hypothetical protein